MSILDGYPFLQSFYDFLEEQEKTFTVDGLIKVLNITKTFTADGLIVNKRTKTFTCDGLVMVETPKTFTVDGYVGIRRTKTFTVDALLGPIYYLLDEVILPRPSSFSRTYSPVRNKITTISGKTGWDITGDAKEIYNLEWKFLSKDEFDALLTLVETNEVVGFKVTDGNLQIPLTNVIPHIGNVSYTVLGSDYLLSVQLELIAES